MTSNQDQNTIVNLLKNNIALLKKYEGKNKNIILKNAIEIRLNKSLTQYYKELNKSFEKLYEYNETNNLKIMKKLNKD